MSFAPPWFDTVFEGLQINKKERARWKFVGDDVIEGKRLHIHVQIHKVENFKVFRRCLDLLPSAVFFLNKGTIERERVEKEYSRQLISDAMIELFSLR